LLSFIQLCGAVAVCLIVAGCSDLTRDSENQPLQPVGITTADDCLHHCLAITDRIYSGGEPGSTEAMQTLRQLGVRTVISVDGARPPVELAGQFGLRYVHIPIGYDGIPPQAQAMLVRAVHESEGRIYVHCHHGQHRGPAAAIVCAKVNSDLSATEALQILETAGTSREYAGLRRDAIAFHPSDAVGPAPPLVEVAEVDSLVAAMASLGRANDHLKLLADSNWGPNAGHPDLVATQETLILYEGFFESQRHLRETNPYDAQFVTAIGQATELAKLMSENLRQQDWAQASATFQRIQRTCVDCHADYRN
jgi:protein tyrosine phosphatase (PTP) superfamily phosphohydrolase (DUF442 family)